jgi:hypothetical protein
MTSMPERRGDDEHLQGDDLADARAEHAVHRAQARQSRQKIREIKRARRSEAVARAATTVTPATRGALMAAGTASLAGAVTQLASGDGSGAADWLSAGIGCWTLAVLRR